MTDVHKTSAWKAVAKHHHEMEKVTLSELFKKSGARAKKFTTQFGQYHVDFSKNHITEETIELLLELARASRLQERITDMMIGQKINSSENRAVLHTALRSTSKVPLVIDGMDVRPMVRRELIHMARFAEDIRSGRWKGYTEKPITDVINIGIGGSDLGPYMAYEALKAYSDRNIRCHFVANIDGTHLSETLRMCNPETTLFIIASKTFLTDETMTNAKSAKAWFTKSTSSPEAFKRHFVALTTDIPKAAKYGISGENCFGFWDWVGGRYSLTSAMGLSLMIAIGEHQFKEFLSGFEFVDDHFATTPIEQNVPVLLGLLDVWYATFFSYTSRVILPYEQYLHKLPAFLQQLMMESNGKSVTREGADVEYMTAPVIWGEPGSPIQHSFTQMLLQGTTIVPVDFIVYANTRDPLPEHHKKLVANCFAQAEALAFGKSDAVLTKEGVDKKLIPHKRMPGNRPSTVLLGDELTPRSLGELIALYEHRTFVQGVIWNINSFDQFGVELGKKLAVTIYDELGSNTASHSVHDSSTSSLIASYKKLQG